MKTSTSCRAAAAALLVFAVAILPSAASAAHRLRRHHAYRTRTEMTYPVVAGSGSVRINSVGQVILTDPDKSKPVTKP